MTGYKLSARAQEAEDRRKGIHVATVDGERVDDEHHGMVISEAALMESRVSNRPTAPIENVVARPAPMPGTFRGSSAMAMDSTPLTSLPPLQGLIQWATQGVFHEGQTFLGYQYLAQLAQRVEYRHASEIWAEHATRKWIKLRGDAGKVEAITAELERLNAKECFYEALLNDGLFGRCHIALDFGDVDDQAEMGVDLIVQPGKIGKARPLKALKVVEPMWVYPGSYETQNPMQPDFYKPDIWHIQGMEVHDSRLLTFVSQEVPDMLKPAYAFGGMSRSQEIKAYVDNWLRTRQSVSDMVHTFSVMVLATDMANVLAGQPGAGSDIGKRVTLFNNYRDNRGTMVINKDTEALENVAVPLSGLDKLQAQAQEQIASAARIPLSIYLQVTPTGLNASSEGEIRSFYADVAALNSKVARPNFKRLLDIVQLSLFDTIDPAITFEFQSLWEMSDTDRAEVRNKDADTDAKYVAMGAISPEDVRERVAGDESNPYHGIELTPLPEPEDDDGEDDAEEA